MTSASSMSIASIRNEARAAGRRARANQTREIPSAIRLLEDVHDRRTDFDRIEREAFAPEPQRVVSDRDHFRSNGFPRRLRQGHVVELDATQERSVEPADRQVARQVRRRATHGQSAHALLGPRRFERHDADDHQHHDGGNHDEQAREGDGGS